MRLRLSFKNSARSVLNLLLIALLLSGCSSSTCPSFQKQDIEKAIQNICIKEYNMYVRAKLVGHTLWVYLPLEDMLVKSDKPEKYIDRFEIGLNKASLLEDDFKVDYAIKEIPEQEKFQDYKYNKDVPDKINNVLRVIIRVLFSMERSAQSEPAIFCIVTADIKNGFETKEVFFLQDLKKVYYQFISRTEYQHRTIDQTEMSADIIGDRIGKHLNYKDISFEEFLTMQTEHRIKLKFQKPEVGKNADIDKEILKASSLTLNAYNFKEFKDLELYNALTKRRVILNKAAVLQDTNEKQ